MNYLSSCSNLMVLQLHSNNKITDDGVIAISKCCTNLHTLRLAYLDAVTDVGISHLMHLPELSFLTIEFLRGITIESCQSISQCRTLISLKWEGHQVVINNTFFHGLAKNCGLLEELQLHNCIDVTDEGILDLCRHCPRLTIFSLSRCPKFSDVSLIAMGENCPRLAYLVVGKINKGISDKGIVALSEGCYSLKILDVFNGIYSASLTYKPVTDIGITALGRNCPNLESLSTQYFHITDASLLQFKCLMDINVRGCKKITAFGVDHLLENCRGTLKALNLESCPQFSEQEIDRWRAQNENLSINSKK